MTVRLKLSLCMIVKDEAETLEHCLNSVQDLVSEIIIVDTGSTDETRSICASFGAEVYEWAWTDHFADARNYGLDKATGDWILMLDADETIEFASATDILHFLAQDDADAHLVSMINYMGSRADPHHAFLFAQYRLFRNRIGFRYVNRVHEHLNTVEMAARLSDTSLPEFIIHHYGYMDDRTEGKQKHRRNLVLLEKEQQIPGYDPWIDYHIASEYYRVGEYADAFHMLNQSISRFLEKEKLPPSLLYKMKYDILLATGSLDHALSGIDKVLQLYPDYVDLKFYKGIFLFVERQYEEAIAVFRECLELGESDRYLTRRGVGSFQAWALIGRCHEEMGAWPEAEAAYRQSLLLYPEYAEVQARLRERIGD